MSPSENLTKSRDWTDASDQEDGDVVLGGQGVFLHIDVSRSCRPQFRIRQYAREQYRALHCSIDVDSDSSSSWVCSHKDSSSENEFVFVKIIETETGDEEEDSELISPTDLVICW